MPVLALLVSLTKLKAKIIHIAVSLTVKMKAVIKKAVIKLLRDKVRLLLNKFHRSNQVPLHI